MEIYPRMFTEALLAKHRIGKRRGVWRQGASEAATEDTALARGFWGTCACPPGRCTRQLAATQQRDEPERTAHGGQGGGRANHRRTHCATSTVKAHKTTLRDAHTQFVATNTCDKIEENIIRPLQDHGLLGEDEGRGQGAGLRGSAASVLFHFGGKRGEILMRARHTGVLLTSGTLHIKNK